MRLFIAIDLPAHVRDALAVAQSRLRRGDLALRWSAVERMHLTLQFLGETDAGLLPDLLAALAALPAPTFALRLAGLGAFPSAERPRVLWGGLDGELTVLADLQRAVVAATRPLGFLPEQRAFFPHLTLGRTRQEASPAQIQTIAAALRAAPPPAPAAWDVGRPRLFQSTPTSGGMIYTDMGP